MVCGFTIILRLRLLGLESHSIEIEEYVISRSVFPRYLTKMPELVSGIFY